MMNFINRNRQWPHSVGASFITPCSPTHPSLRSQGVMNDAPTTLPISMVKFLHHALLPRSPVAPRSVHDDEFYQPKQAMASFRRGVIHHALLPRSPVAPFSV